jgi:sugar lactone lactonase YvrE
MKRILYLLLFLFAVGLAYLLLWPVPITPAAWTPPPAPSLAGPYEVNERLKGVERVGQEGTNAPEDVAVDNDGRVYGGMLDGRILRWSPDLTRHELFADTGGRPLGLHFDAQEQLIVADAVRGLLKIDRAGEITVLATEEGGRPFAFADDVDIGRNGTIYFSDASDRFGFRHYVADLMEHQPNGRLLAYEPATQTTRLLMDDLYFANGVAVSPDQQFVLVVETGKYRVQRYWLEGEKAGTSETLIENLPGFPDGISTGTNGIFWIALASPRDPTLDRLLPWPFLRKVVYRLPEFLQPAPRSFGFILGVDAQGTVVHNLQDPEGAYAPITSVQEHGGFLYLGSIIEPAFGRIPAPDNIAGTIEGAS